MILHQNESETVNQRTTNIYHVFIRNTSDVVSSICCAFLDLLRVSVMCSVVL